MVYAFGVLSTLRPAGTVRDMFAVNLSHDGVGILDVWVLSTVKNVSPGSEDDFNERNTAGDSDK